MSQQGEGKPRPYISPYHSKIDRALRRGFDLDPLNDLFQEIVGLRAHYQVLIGEDERRYAIQPVLVRQVDIGGHLCIKCGVFQHRCEIACI